MKLVWNVIDVCSAGLNLEKNHHTVYITRSPVSVYILQRKYHNSDFFFLEISNTYLLMDHIIWFVKVNVHMLIFLKVEAGGKNLKFVIMNNNVRMLSIVTLIFDLLPA